MSKSAVWLIAAIVAGSAAAAPDPAAHGGGIEAWRAKRLERLQSPTGWLSLVGLEWLKPVQHDRRAADSDRHRLAPPRISAPTPRTGA